MYVTENVQEYKLLVTIKAKKVLKSIAIVVIVRTYMCNVKPSKRPQSPICGWVKRLSMIKTYTDNNKQH